MPKKIYDIKPPKMAAKTKKASVVSEDKKIPVRTRRRSAPAVVMENPVRMESVPRMENRERMSRAKAPRSVFWPAIISVLVVVSLIGTYLFFKLPKADVTIWPKVETLSYQQTLTADKSVSSIDLANKLIPAKYFQTSKTNSQDFPATGNASNEGYATGTVTVYNKFNPPEGFNFKAGTHFLSDTGKLFVATEKIVLPASTKSGSKITPGSVTVSIKATESGDGYNIAPSNFSVPGLKGTAYYYSVYAVSTKAMEGGYSGKVKKVTDDDIQGAKDVLIKKSTDEAVADLRSQIPADYVLIDDAISSSVTSVSTAVKAGTVAQNFNCSATVQASALAFKKSDIEQLAKKYIINQMLQSQTLLEDSFKLDYSAAKVDISSGKITLATTFSSGAYQSIDKNSLELSLLGKDANQIKSAIDSSLGQEAQKVQVDFWPFWVNRAPNNQRAVNVLLKFQ